MEGSGSGSNNGSANEKNENEKATMSHPRRIQDYFDTTTAVSTVVGAGLLALGASYLFSSSEKKPERKKMKAPGRDYEMYRDVFEENTADYFRDLRKK